MKIKKFLYSNFEIIILILLFIFVKSFFLIKFHELIWDESVYLAAGKYLYSSGTIGLWEMVRPPVLIIFTGLFWKLNFNIVLASEILSLVFASSLLYFNYVLSKLFFDRKYSFLSSLILVITPLFFLYSSYILTEIPATLFLIISIYSFLSKRYFASGLMCGFSILTKFTQLWSLPVFFILFLTQFKTNKNISRIFFSFSSGIIIVLLPFLLFNIYLYDDYVSNSMVAAFRPFILASEDQDNIGETFQGVISQKLFYFYNLFSKFHLQILSLLGIILFFVGKKFKDLRYLSLFLFFITFLLYFTYIANKQDRFVLLLLPFFTFFTIFAIQQMTDYFVSKKFNTRLILLFCIIFIFTLSINAILQDKNYYSWRIFEPSERFRDFSQFFDTNTFDGAVFTSDPTFAGYIDKLFIPYYFVLKYKLETYNEIDANKKIGAVIYTPRSFISCQPGDFVCFETKEKFLDGLRQKYGEKFYKKYGGEEYYVFTTE